MDASERERRVQTVCLMIVSAVAIAVGLYWLRSILIPFVLALFLVYALKPLIDLQMRRLRLPRVVAVISTLLVCFVLLFLVGLLVSHSVTQMTRNAGRYQRQIEKLIDRAAAALPLEKLGVRPEPKPAPEADAAPATRPAPAAKPESRPFGMTVGRLQSIVLSVTSAILSLVSQGTLVLIFVFFLLLGQSQNAHAPSDVRDEVERRVNRYIVTKIVLSGITGVLVGVVLALLGVEMAMAFGFMAFLMNFIPSIGSIIATLLPMPVVLLMPGVSPTTVVLALVGPGAIQFVVGNVIEPRLMGKSLDLHPVAILLMLMFWGMLWGIVGMFLATPMTAVAKILLDKSEFTRPAANLLAGRLEADEPPAQG